MKYISTYNVYIFDKCGSKTLYNEEYENDEFVRCEKCTGTAYLSHKEEKENII